MSVYECGYEKKPRITQICSDQRKKSLECISNKILKGAMIKDLATDNADCNGLKKNSIEK
jgi:hypothetical protein